MEKMIERMTPQQRSRLLTSLFVTIGAIGGATMAGAFGVILAPLLGVLFSPGVSIGNIWWGLVALGAVSGAMYILWFTRKLRLPC